MIKLNEFNEIMATKLTSLLISSSSTVASVNVYKSLYKDEYYYNIHVKETDGGICRFTFITSTFTSKTTSRQYITSIIDINSNPIIEYDTDKKEYIVLARQTDSPFYVRRALVYLMNLKNASPDVTMSKEKQKMIKQQKRIYPNIFDREGASIKDIQYFTTKKDKNTITIVWTDKDEKGHNKTTTVSVDRKHFDPEIGIAMAIARRYFGGRNEFLKVVDKATKLNEKRFNNRKRRAELKKKKKKEIRGH